MKTIGLLGGTTCESSLTYYKLINEMVRERLGGHNSAKSVMVSINFADIQPLTERDDWDGVQAILLQAARAIERAGADFLLLCANTVHKVADGIRRGIGIPIVHIVDATAAKLLAAGYTKVGLLGTRFTMEQDFFIQRLQQKHGITALVPDTADRQHLHHIIIQELAVGRVLAESEQACRRMIAALSARGAQAVILGCTELPLLIDSSQGLIPLFDTTLIHAEAAVDLALAAGP